MRYLGGKSKIRLDLAGIINKEVGYNSYLEPFVGGAWVLQEITHTNRLASDINPYLITLYHELQKGWQPPDFLSLADYNRLRSSNDKSDPLVAFAGFGCSFAGKWFGGYARSEGKKCYAATTKRSLLKQLPRIKEAAFSCNDYRNYTPDNALIYCDPPYANTTQYSSCKDFNSLEFWDIMRKWSKTNKVFISEYSAPKDFICVASFSSRMGLRENNVNNVVREEKLFTFNY